MKTFWKVFALYATLLLGGSVSFAQTSVVTATAITDSDSVEWINGTVSIAFVPNPSYPNPSSYSLCMGGALTPSVLNQGPISLGTNASFSFTVYDSTTVCPVKSQWMITVCPNAQSKCGSIITQITGSSTDVTALINTAIPAPRFNAIAGAYGYADIEAITTLPVGATYWSTSSGCQRYNNGSTWLCNDNIPSWNILNYTTCATYISGPNPCPLSNNVTDGTVTSGSANISAPDTNFTDTAGQLVVVEVCPSNNTSCNFANTTSWSCVSTTCTFTGSNTFAAGNPVMLYKFLNGTNGGTTFDSTVFNGQTVTVTSATSSQFVATVSGASTASATESGRANNITSGFADFEGTIISGSGTTATLSSNVPFSLTGNAEILWGQDVGKIINKIQSALCTSWRFNQQRYSPSIIIPTGFYLDATPSEWICGNYQGEGNAQFSSTIYWAGVSGAIPFFKNPSGDSGIWSMNMMSLATPSRNSYYPAGWLKIQTETDNTTVFEDVHISNVANYGVWIDATTENFHPNRIRCDDNGGPCFLHTIQSGDNQGTLSITGTTNDQGLGNGTQLGTVLSTSVLEIDNTVGAGNPLTVSIIGAQRFESEGQLPNHFAIIRQDGASPNSINYRLADMTIQQSLNTNTYDLFYLNNSASIVNFGSQVELENIKFDPLLINFVDSTSGGSATIGAQCQVANGYSATCFPTVTTTFNQNNGVPDSDFKFAATYWPNVDGVFSWGNTYGADGFNGWLYTGTGSASGSHYLGNCATVGVCTVAVANNEIVTLSGAIMGANVTSGGGGQPYWALVPSVGGTPYCQAFNNGAGLNSGYIQNGATTKRASCTYINSTGSTLNILIEAATGNSTVTNLAPLYFSNPQVEIGANSSAYKSSDFSRGNSISNKLPASVLSSIAPTCPGPSASFLLANPATATGLTANESGLSLYTVPASGGCTIYRVCAYQVLTTAGSVSSTLPTLNVQETDSVSGTQKSLQIGTSSTNNSVGTLNGGCTIINPKVSTVVSVSSTNYASNLAGMTYNITGSIEGIF